MAALTSSHAEMANSSTHHNNGISHHSMTARQRSKSLNQKAKDGYRMSFMEGINKTKIIWLGRKKKVKNSQNGKKNGNNDKARWVMNLRTIDENKMLHDYCIGMNISTDISVKDLKDYEHYMIIQSPFYYYDPAFKHVGPDGRLLPNVDLRYVNVDIREGIYAGYCKSVRDSGEPLYGRYRTYRTFEKGRRQTPENLSQYITIKCNWD